MSHSDPSDSPDSIANVTTYAPVTFHQIDPVPSPDDSATPIGRMRLAAESEGDRRVGLPHGGCGSLLIAGLPRQGKDSTLVSLAQELKTNHG